MRVNVLYELKAWLNSKSSICFHTGSAIFLYDLKGFCFATQFFNPSGTTNILCIQVT